MRNLFYIVAMSRFWTTLSVVVIAGLLFALAVVSNQRDDLNRANWLLRKEVKVQRARHKARYRRAHPPFVEPYTVHPDAMAVTSASLCVYCGKWKGPAVCGCREEPGEVDP